MLRLKFDLNNSSNIYTYIQFHVLPQIYCISNKKTLRLVLSKIIALCSHNHKLRITMLPWNGTFHVKTRGAYSYQCLELNGRLCLLETSSVTVCCFRCIYVQRREVFVVHANKSWDRQISYAGRQRNRENRTVAERHEEKGERKVSAEREVQKREILSLHKGVVGSSVKDQSHLNVWRNSGKVNCAVISIMIALKMSYLH